MPEDLFVPLPGGSLRLVRIPAGRLRMGSDDGRADERPVLEHDLVAFWMGVSPVTCAQYRPYLDVVPEPPRYWDLPGFCGAARPVVGLDWHVASAYAAWVGALLGRVGRLPSEAEWEWAARGGQVGQRTAWGPELPEGEIPSGPLEGPWPVGQGQPNGFGLVDMGTIVHEWCADAYGPYGGPPAEPLRRASRGGSWRHLQRWSTPANRSSLPPDSRYSDYGLRVLVE